MTNKKPRSFTMRHIASNQLDCVKNYWLHEFMATGSQQILYQITKSDDDACRSRLFDRAYDAIRWAQAHERRALGKPDLPGNPL